jgi:hypothetical protein
MNENGNSPHTVKNNIKNNLNSQPQCYVILDFRAINQLCKQQFLSRNICDKMITLKFVVDVNKKKRIPPHHSIINLVINHKTLHQSTPNTSSFTKKREDLMFTFLPLSLCLLRV